MKKNLFSVIVGLLVFGVATHAAAVNPNLSLLPAPVNGYPGGGVLLDLQLTEGVGGYAGMNARIILPEGIELKGVKKGDLLSTQFVTDYRSFQGDTNNWCTVIAYSGSDVFGSTPGEILTLTLSVPKDATPGTYNIQFATTDINTLVNSKHAISNQNGSASVTHTNTNGSIVIRDGTDSDGDNIPDSYENIYFGNLNRDGTGDYDKDGKTDLQEFYDGTDPKVSENQPGDLDGDGKVELDDAIIALTVICGVNTSNENLIAADLNQDGKIGIEETIYIMQKVSGLR